MPVATCKHCGNTRLYDDDLIGRVVTCSQCQGRIKIREAGASAPKARTIAEPGKTRKILAADERPESSAPVEGPSRFGLTLAALGLGGFLLPHLGLQLRMLNRLGDDQHLAAAALAVAGAVITAFSLRARPPLALAAGAAILLLAGFGWSALPGNPANAVAAQPGPPASAPAMIPVVATPGPKSPPFSAPRRDASTPAANPFGAPAAPPASETNSQPAPVAVEPAPASGDDLLARADLRRDVLNGQWQRDATGIVSPPATNAAQMLLPGELPVNYRMTLVAEHVGGADKSFTVGFPVGRSTGMMVFDGWNIPASGLSLVDGRTGDNNPTTRRGQVLKAGPNTIVITVDRQKVKVEANGQPIVDFAGPAQRLSLDQRFWKVPPEGRAFVGSWQASFRFRGMQVEHL